MPRKTKLDPKQTYTATIVLSSMGDDDRVALDGVFFDPDVTDEDIDSGNVPWSYRIASYMLTQMKKEVLEEGEWDEDYPLASKSIM